MIIKQWLLGITGGIAAYKTPELVRLLKKQGADLRVVLSQGAHAFVTPMTLQAVSAHPVYSALLDTDFEAAMGHIELARWAQGILIAPLSANRLAALALGMADDLLTTLCLATTAPIWVAPAMNQQMWQHPTVQAHIATLQARGMTILGPDWGEQACGEIGLGRMMEPSAIVSQLAGCDAPSLGARLDKVRVLITAGPTREAIDPVRFLSNRSSGKMGFALAQAALALGAQVTLVSGPVALATPSGVVRENVVSAKEMYAAVMHHIGQTDIFISAAAVSDFMPATLSPQKIKKSSFSADWQLNLVPTPDILAHVAQAKERPFCVGFAAETENIIEYAQKKRHEKNLDLIAVNDVSTPDIGFDAPCNALTVIGEKTYHIPKNTKYQVGLALLQIISECYHENRIKNS